MDLLRTRPTGLGGPAAHVLRAGRKVRDGASPASQMKLCLQDINFGCPWPLRESPHLESARNHALSWMVEFGLVKDPEGSPVRDSLERNPTSHDRAYRRLKPRASPMQLPCLGTCRMDDDGASRR